MSTKHTPKPWNLRWERRQGTTPGQYQLIDTGPLEFGWDGEEGIYTDNPADFALIDAAPDLLAACEGLVQAHDTGMGKSALRLRLDLADIAIAKAKAGPE